jgi:SAM-dependent methyltransferase
MRLHDAIDMLTGSGVEGAAPTTWADLGCGDGIFTRALAESLAAGSTINAMDRDGAALRKIPAMRNGVRIATCRGDFTNQPWPFADLDGVLMANSLHYVERVASFIRACESHMKARRRFLVVEYDTDQPSRWVPYPLSQTRLRTLFEGAGYSSISVLRTRPSIYRRAALYAVSIAQS